MRYSETYRNFSLAAVAVLSALVMCTSAADPPMPKRQGEIEYMSGGVGLEQSDAAGAPASYNLGLTFTATGGPFLEEVRVRVEDKKGVQVLDAVAGGPRMLVALPAGRYGVTATFAGRAQSRSAEVPGEGRTELQFSWPVADSQAQAKIVPTAASTDPSGSCLC